MYEDNIFRALRPEYSSLEISNEKLIENRSSSNNQHTITMADLETNIITMIKEIEKKPTIEIDDSSDSKSNLFLGKTHFRLFREKQRLQKTGFAYTLAFLFISILHIFNVINGFELLYSKDFLLYDYYSPLFFVLLGFILNIFWFAANILAILALFKKKLNFILYTILLLSLAFLLFLADLSLYIYNCENNFANKIGAKNLLFLILEGVLIVIFTFGANHFRIRMERIKFLKTLELEASN